MNEPEFPDGKLNEEDEGEIGVAIGIEDGRVIIMFPKPVAWFGLPGEQSIEMGRTLIKRGREALAKAKD
jgi:hypothetical protein